MARARGRLQRQWRTWQFTPAVRDTTLFTAGLVLTIHEVVIRSGPERPTVLLLLAGMMGLPAFLRADGGGKEDDE